MAVEKPADHVADHKNKVAEPVRDRRVDLLGTRILAKRGNATRSEYQTVFRGLGADLLPGGGRCETVKQLITTQIDLITKAGASRFFCVLRTLS